MRLGSKSKINDFILLYRTKMPLTLEHDVLGITIDPNIKFIRNYVRNLQITTFYFYNNYILQRSYIYQNHPLS